jgi:hypothetical protein
MSDTITKILFRKGTDIQRRTADSTGIIFSSGEPGWCFDTNRLFVGDGSTAGGFPVGMQNLGIMQQFFGEAGSGYTEQALNAFNERGAVAGDIIYDRDTRAIYSLTSSADFPPVSSNFIKLDVSPLLNKDMLEYNLSKEIQIKNSGVGPLQIGFGVVDGLTLIKSAVSEPISVRDGGITNRKIATMYPNSLKGNSSLEYLSPIDIKVSPMHVVGRTATSNLTSFSFNTILAEASFNGANGVVISKTGITANVSLDSTKFTIGPSRISLLAPTVINSTLSASGNITCAQDIIAYASLSDKRLKNDLTKIDNSLTKVKALNGYEFTFNNDAPEHLVNKKSYGLIAQEVEDVLPHAVDQRPNGFKGVDYEKVIPLLVESIKELKTEIDNLKCNLINK